MTDIIFIEWVFPMVFPKGGDSEHDNFRNSVSTRVEEDWRITLYALFC